MHKKLFSTGSSTKNEYRMEQEQYIKSSGQDHVSLQEASTQFFREILENRMLSHN